tara:strand:- start:925 stop:2451 length:1527 start_codon:yes stop_codon:yes gene_type:complete
MKKHRNIKKITVNPASTEKKKQYPRLSIRKNQKPSITNPRQGVVTRSRKILRNPLTEEIAPPIKFLENIKFNSNDSEICFVVGGGPSLNGFDFNQLNEFDTIAVNKAVEYIPNPNYFITTDYSYFIKAALPIERIKQKSQNTYFVANMTHDYMSFQNGRVVDTRRNFVYNDLYQYTGVIESNNIDGFGSSLAEFSNGGNSGHCGIQLALLLGYKKIYLLGFDLNADGQTHFHQSYREVDQKSFKGKVKGYGETLLKSLADYKGSQEIINLSNSSILTTSPHIKTESFNDILVEKGIKFSTPNTDNSDLTNLMVVGYYTVNTPYEEEANNLLESLNNLGINHDISGVKTLGNWQANTRFKAGFMLDMLIKHPTYRLLYVDVDAVVHRMPDLFKNYHCDIAVRWQDFRWRKNECLSGTIYMENNERTKRICELWRDINVKEGNKSNRMEQWNLDTVINQMKKEDPSFTYKNLPPEYTMIFDSMRGMYPDITPVIEHFQASRRFKKDVNEE